jgi:hypothetical protein
MCQPISEQQRKQPKERLINAGEQQSRYICVIVCLYVCALYACVVCICANVLYVVCGDTARVGVCGWLPYLWWHERC